jgi:hypothetical protein
MTDRTEARRPSTNHFDVNGDQKTIDEVLYEHLTGRSSEGLPELIRGRLRDALREGNPNRDVELFTVAQLMVAATGSVEEGMSLYEEFTLEHLI